MVLLSSLLVATATIFSSTTNAIPSYGSCPASDQCLKAVKGNGYASKDCKAVLHKNVTSGKLCTETTTKRITKTSTIFRTKTNTAFSTEISLSTFTPVETETVTTTTTTVPLVVIQPRETPAAALEARNEQKRRTPAYATKPCKNASQYKSACSCIGVKPSTKTLAPTRTITRTKTVATVRVTRTRTISVTAITTAVSTVTDPTTSTTTTTETETATATPSDPDAVPPGGGCGASRYFTLIGPAISDRRYLLLDADGVISLTPTLLSGTIFALTPSGLLRSVAEPQFALQTLEDRGATPVFGSEELDGAVLRCGIVGSNGDLQCAEEEKDVFIVCPPGGEEATVQFGSQALVDEGVIGVGCQSQVFRAASPCRAT